MIAQTVHRGPAPFLLTEAVAAEPPALPAPHFRLAHQRGREMAAQLDD